MSEYDKAPARALHRFTLGGAARKREGSSLESPSFGRNFKNATNKTSRKLGQNDISRSRACQELSGYTLL